MAQRTIKKCLRCKEYKPHSARGLCGNCAKLSKLDDTYDDYPRLTRKYSDLVEEYEHLKRNGSSVNEIAHRLGYSTVDTMRLTLIRAKAWVAQNASSQRVTE